MNGKHHSDKSNSLLSKMLIKQLLAIADSSINAAAQLIMQELQTLGIDFPLLPVHSLSSRIIREHLICQLKQTWFRAMRTPLTFGLL